MRKLNNYTGLFLLLILIVWLISLIFYKPTVIIKNVEVPITPVDTVQGIACYDLSGAGPLENCGVQVRCYKKPQVNGDVYLIPCPSFIPGALNTADHP